MPGRLPSWRHQDASNSEDIRTLPPTRRPDFRNTNTIIKLLLANKVPNNHLCFNKFARTVIFRDCQSGSSGEGASLQSGENHRSHGPHASARACAPCRCASPIETQSSLAILRACTPGSAHLPRSLCCVRFEGASDDP